MLKYKFLSNICMLQNYIPPVTVVGSVVVDAASVGRGKVVWVH